VPFGVHGVNDVACLKCDGEECCMVFFGEVM
jgi:hypothetical protein